jgi:sarcosine oxidase, subunit alpha
VRTVARSFKFHRPRGVFAAGIEEPNALVQLGTGARAIFSARAPAISLRPGLDVRTQSGWPSASFDVLRLLDCVAPLFAAGFYNKTFMWPSWHTYEPIIRRMAGLGEVTIEPDPDRYECRNAHCDVLVIGGGITGLRAAAAAAAAGERVILAEQEEQMGGRARWSAETIDGTPAQQWLDRVLRRLRDEPDVRMMLGTTVVGVHDQGVATLFESVTPGDVSAVRERYWIVRARRVVLATGAIEQPLVFCNNDRPGVMLAGAARRYLHCQAIAPGRQVVIATNNDSPYALVQELRAAGVTVRAVVDSRSHVQQALINQMRSLSVPVNVASMPVDTHGFAALRAVSIGRLTQQGVAERHRLECDALLVSGGWNPGLQLYAQAGGKLLHRARSRALEPIGSISWIDVATQSSPDEVGPRICPAGQTSRQWVDLRHDVTVADLELAIRENFAGVEHVKRYTTVGMSVDQGKTSNLAALEVIARLRDKKPSELGYTTFRPPLTPITLGAIAGRDIGDRFTPARRSALQAWHAAHGAVFKDFGEWKRPAMYLRPGESEHVAVQREARRVRSSVGLFDASPLGKIEINGPDAREFLDRFYINDLRTLQPQRARYGIMLREAGIIFDDGTITSLAPDRLLITTTSGGAGTVGSWLEEWHQCEWPELRLAITPVTECWSTIAICGPHARDVLARLRPECDISNSALPHLGVRETQLLGAPARIYRISFSGELTYEVNVSHEGALAVWEALLEAGQEFGIEPYGIDALLHLRLEKGFLHVGTDTDGTTIPDDVGLGQIAARKSQDFIGKRSLALKDHKRSDRLHLVGLAGSDRPLPIGAHLRFANSSEATDGWITSAGLSTLEHRPIALARLRAGRQRLDSEVEVHDGGKIVSRARIVNSCFYDPAGTRING